MDKSRNRSRSTLRNNFESLPTDPRLRRHSPPIDQQLRSDSPPTDPRLRKNVHAQRIRENYREKPNFNREIKKELEEEQKKPMANATSSFHIPVIRDPVMKFEDTEQRVGINQGTLAKSSSIRSESPEPEVPRMTMEQIKALDFTWTEEETEKECPLCKITCTGQTPWEEHLKGKKHHWYKQKALGLNPRPLEKNLIYYAKYRNPYRPYDFDPKERPIEQFKEIYGIMSKVFRCEMCDMDATDIEIYKQHIAGRNHKRMLVEDKFTGNNILKDICGYEECCEDLKKACAACGNTIWWGQCGHAMHQCCAKKQLARDVNCPVCNEPWQLEKRTRALKP